MQTLKTIDSLFYSELGKKLREIRHSKGLTLKEVSEETGFSRTLIDHWELGLNKIKPHQFERLCQALQVSPDLYVNLKIGCQEN